MATDETANTEARGAPPKTRRGKPKVRALRRAVEPGLVHQAGKPVQTVSLGEEARATERRAADDPVGAATKGLVRNAFRASGSTRDGVVIIRHMMPFWRDVDDLLEMIDLWVAGANRIYEENEP